MQVLDQPCLDPPALALVVRFGQAAAHHQGCAQGCGRRHSGLLLDRHDAQAVAYPQLAIVQHQAAGDRGQQRALAAAVAPDQPDPFAGADGKRGLIEQRRGTECQFGAGDAEQCHPILTMPIIV